MFSFSTAPQLVTAALGAGAGGFVSKTVNGRQLADAIVTVADGHRVVLTPAPHRHRDGALGWPGRGRDLSARDSELLVLLRQGYTNREIAERLYLSENTVKTHLRRLFHKLGVSNRTQAAMVATEDEEFRPRTATPTPAAAGAARPSDPTTRVRHRASGPRGWRIGRQRSESAVEEPPMSFPPQTTGAG